MKKYLFIGLTLASVNGGALCAQQANSRDQMVDKSSWNGASRDQMADKSSWSGASRDQMADKSSWSGASRDQMVDKSSWNGASRDQMADKSSWSGASRDQMADKSSVSQSDLKEVSRQFNLLFPGPYSIGDRDSDKDIPELMSGGEVLNRNDKVAAFAKKHDAHVAVLVKQRDDFVIIASNLKKANGMSVDQLKLGRDNPAYKNLNGEMGFHGKVMLWGKEYMTKVDPLKNKKGKIIGALLVAMPVAAEKSSWK